MFRNLPSVLSPVDWSTWGERYPVPARAADRSAILDLVARYEGPESADIAAGWFDRQLDGFVVIREPDATLRGVLALLDLTAASASDRAADPGAQAAWERANSPDPVRAGEIVTQTRFVIDAQAYQAPSPTINATSVVTVQRFLQTPSLAFEFLTLADPDQWDDYFALADMPRVDGADFTVGNRRYGLFCHDFRAVPMDALLELWTERALSQDAIVAAGSGRRRCWCCRSPTSPMRYAGRCTIFTAPTCWRVARCCAPDCCANGPAPRIRTPGTLTPSCAKPWRRCASTRVTTSCAGGRADLPSTRRDAGGRCGRVGSAVQHLPPAPQPGRRAHRLLVLGA